MAWMAVLLKIILFTFCFICRFSDFSVAFVFRRGGSLRRFSKNSNQLIYSLNSVLFFFQANIANVVLYYCRDCNSVIKIRKLKFFTNLSMYVLRSMCDCIVTTNNTCILKMNLYLIPHIFMLILQILCILMYFSAYGIFLDCL